HHERRAVGDVAVGIEHAVGADRRPVHVAQERKREVARFHEGRVTEGAITADPDHGGAAPGDLLGNPAEVAQLGCSDAPPVVTVEDEHDVLALEVCQRRLTARSGRQREVRCGLTEAETGHARLSGRSTVTRSATRAFMWWFYRYITFGAGLRKPWKRRP